MKADRGGKQNENQGITPTAVIHSTQQMQTMKSFTISLTSCKCRSVKTRLNQKANKAKKIHKVQNHLFQTVSAVLQLNNHTRNIICKETQSSCMVVNPSVLFLIACLWSCICICVTCCSSFNCCFNNFFCH